VVAAEALLPAGVNSEWFTSPVKLGSPFPVQLVDIAEQAVLRDKCEFGG
jgi:hypothetical protein